MKIEAKFLIILGTFFGIMGLAYGYFTYNAGGTELGGFIMLLGSAILGLFPGAYYLWWHGRMGDRPEDRDDATIDSGKGTIDTFPGSSIWPFVLGMGAFLGTLSLVFGLWLAVPAIGLFAAALSGGTAESRRGGTV